MTAPHRNPPDVHPIRCTCEICDPVPARLSADEETIFGVLGGIVLALVLIELYALLTGSPHFTVMFGGQG